MFYFSIQIRCCRINVLLVIMQLCLGGMVTTLAFYMGTLTPSLKIRECPYWAGIPVSTQVGLIQGKFKTNLGKIDSHANVAV